MLRYIPFVPTLLRVFIINRCWIVSSAFSASIEKIMWYLSIVLLMWYITLNDLQILNHLFIPGINTTWSCCMILFMNCSIQFVNIWLRIFAFFTYINLQFLLCYQGGDGLIDWVWEYSLFFNFWNSLRKIDINYSLCVCYISPVNLSGSEHLCVETFLTTDSIPILVIDLFRLSISFWFSLGRLYVSRNFSIYFRLSNILVYDYS